jgi:alkaline phosphatase
MEISNKTSRHRSNDGYYWAVLATTVLAWTLGSCSFGDGEPMGVNPSDGTKKVGAKPKPYVVQPEPDGTTNRADVPRLEPGKGRRHVIVMIGDGMQMAHEVATSRYLYDADESLSFHSLPVRAFKTNWDEYTYNTRADALGLPHYSPSNFDPKVGYNPDIGGGMPYPLLDDNEDRRHYFVDGPAPDSASTATAMSTGIKTYYSAIGVPPGYDGTNALEHASALLRRFYGMATGFVTTVEYYHATPAAFFAHNASRNAYSEISNELLNQVMPNVMIGAGYNLGVFGPADLERLKEKGTYVYAHRQDGVDGNDTISTAATRAITENKNLFGLFGNASQGNFSSPVPGDYPGNPSVSRGSIEDPTLAVATLSALRVLATDPDGFFLLVEQGDIDRANHADDFARMIGCVSDLDAAVKAVVNFIEEPSDALDWTNTTLIVTADHANSYMRFQRTMHSGDLPWQLGSTYPDGEITYGLGGHSSELTNVYVKGFAEKRVAEYTNVYAGYPHILDETSIYRLILDGARH